MRNKRKVMMIGFTYRGVVRLIVTASLALLMVYVFSKDMSSMKTWSFWTTPLSGKVIAIDAGHGGVDGGASSRDGIIEKNVSLSIALYLRDFLQQAGAVVVMTRESDTDLADTDTKGYSRRKTEDLKNRVKLIKDRQADMLVSVHLNSIPDQKWHGAQTFYHPKSETSRALATFIQEELVKNLTNTNRIPGPAKSVYLLKEMEVPSSLVEVGFLSNSDEARLMADESYQKKVAASIYRGILRYNSGEKLKTQTP